MSESFDRVLVGAGHAALCAAHAALENGCSVLVRERAPEAARGGNSSLTAGAMRTACSTVEDLRPWMPGQHNDEVRMSEVGSCTEENLFDDRAHRLWAPDPVATPSAGSTTRRPAATSRSVMAFCAGFDAFAIRRPAASGPRGRRSSMLSRACSSDAERGRLQSQSPPTRRIFAS